MSRPSARTSKPRKIGCVQHDCADCQKRASQPDRDFYRGVIAALGALKGMEDPTSVHYHEVARTFDLKALARVARSEQGDMEWSGLGKYIRHQKARDAEIARMERAKTGRQSGERSP
jgi:hypothetical protein